MTLCQSELDLVAAWADKAQPLSGVYFRSVSYSFMKPETVLDGAGAAAYGGRFASRGTAAVYLSESDAVATSEVTGRKKRLGGAVLIDVEKYPRVVFAISFELARVLDLSQRPLPRGIGAIRDKCLNSGVHSNLSPSQQFGDVLVSQRVEGLLFPRQAGPGANLIVYKKCCDPDALRIENEEELLAVIAAIARSAK